jgi:hypothetical protein
VDSGGRKDAARRLAAAKSDRWGATRSPKAARRKRWAAVVSRRLTVARRERWGTTVSGKAARVIPQGCRVGGGNGYTTTDW